MIKKIAVGCIKMPEERKLVLLQDINQSDIPFVGLTMSLLARFQKEKLPVSLAFCLTSKAFDEFINSSELQSFYHNSIKTEFSSKKELYDTAREVRLTSTLQGLINKFYTKISGFHPSFVNLIGYVIDDYGNEVNVRSHHFFDVRGEEELRLAIRDMYLDLIFNEVKDSGRFIEGEWKIVIMVQKAQHSEASGIMFTSNILNGNAEEVLIEAVFGLESATGDEMLIPDQYVVHKKDQAISEKYISPQEYMYVRQPGDAKNGIHKVRISPQWQNRQKLEDKHIITLAHTGVIIEEGVGVPIELYWAYESGKIWINFFERINKTIVQTDIDNSLQIKADKILGKPAQDQKTYVVTYHNEDINVSHTSKISSFLQPEKPAPGSEIIQKNHKNQKNILEISEEEINESKKHTMSPQNTVMQDALVQGKYYVGGITEGNICLDPQKAQSNSILVLKGDEEISSTLTLAGFIVEDESEALAMRLNEFFKVPAITGVPLARKILKANERIKMSGVDGKIYETIPFSQQIGNLEVSFAGKNAEEPENLNKETAVNPDNQLDLVSQNSQQKNEITYPQADQIYEEEVEFDEIPTVESISSINSGKSFLKSEELSSTQIDAEEEAFLNKKHDFVDIPAKPRPKVSKTENQQSVDVQFQIPIKEIKSAADTDIVAGGVASEVEEGDKEQVSQILNYVEETNDEIVDFKSKERNIPNVEGVSDEDKFNVWGKSLEKILNVSKNISSPVASEALEAVTESKNDIEQNSKELTFDAEEQYIYSKVHEKQSKLPKFEDEYIPTASKVYIHLIDEALPENICNYDGVIFASSYDVEVFIEILENTLNTSSGKPVYVICPPYESEAFSRFLTLIYNLRNSGNRNLSLILPDYRSKKDIAEHKKALLTTGLKRSSSFEIYANISKSINVFRIEELKQVILDGAYIDLFRLKMNMLGVEKLTASTKYVEGMKNLMEYIWNNKPDDINMVVSVLGFDNIKSVIKHIHNFGFRGIACGLTEVDKVKRYIANLEKKHISGLTSKSSGEKVKIKRKYR